MPMKLQSQTLLSTAIGYFQTVARLGSIRAAAEALNVAPSAVSRQMLKLEQELGAPLFERLPRGLRLTSAGEILIYHARAGASELDRGRARIEELNGLKSGHVALATVESVASGFLVPVLEAFWKEYPRITMNLVVAGSGRVFHSVAEGEAELAVAFDVSASPKLKELTSVSLPIGAVMSPQHALAKEKSLRFRDFLGYPIFLSDNSLTMRPLMESVLRRMTMPLAIRVISNSVYLMNRLVTEGTGVTFETRVGIARELAAGELVYVPLAEPQLRPQRLVLRSRPGGDLSPPAAVLAKSLATALGKLTP